MFVVVGEGSGGFVLGFGDNAMWFCFVLGMVRVVWELGFRGEEFRVTTRNRIG